VVKQPDLIAKREEGKREEKVPSGVGSRGPNRFYAKELNGGKLCL
jgi:hypothetical protein